jgi:hypothetical protein
LRDEYWNDSDSISAEINGKAVWIPYALVDGAELIPSSRTDGFETIILTNGKRAKVQSIDLDFDVAKNRVSMNPRGIDPNLAYKKEYGWTFVDFLKKRLIPDLRESGMDATADDYQRGISLYRDKKGVLPITSFMNYLKYLRGTLIPDLKASGSESTAADFERMYKMVLYTMDRHPKSRGR